MEPISSSRYLDTYTEQKEGTTNLLPSHIEFEPSVAVQLLVRFPTSKCSALSEGQGTPSHSPAVTLSVAVTSVYTVKYNQTVHVCLILHFPCPSWQSDL